MKWSDKEIERFNRLYPITEFNDMIKHFPGVTHAQLKNRASTSGIKKQ